ncbi:4'-phosphopantetheinyl transferase superfamily protein [Roseiconus nitratireducens]|uniref:4'-phosphopantetheinyl transferase superfamily protein n=1 Tax=Roseiconus nitratireducens TaxID=2605748 RepID=A0A5M6DHY5_9BACT|nr:4'-phosphopantetheinyl transferase superfamily protein [Roseiconus nitratireducens]KAA5547167.1 4'-phosphopantetheinyl transferase superfamily protein [Roseiconus nitratireducens]
MRDQITSRSSSGPTESASVHIWHAAVSVDAPGAFESRCEQCLPIEEVRQADRFRRPTTRNQHVVGRAMARRLLGSQGIRPDQIRFGIGPHGKPFVTDPPQACQPFNIAHTDGLVLCGVADPAVELIGVDVECLDRRTSTELAERYFSQPEVRLLRSYPRGEQQMRFLQIWTLKEAYIKAIGTGLHTPLCDFSFESLDADRPTIRFLSSDLQDGRHWQFVCFRPREGFIASAAIVTPDPRQPPDIRWLPFEDLVMID